MASKGLHSFTVQESQNAGLGQAGSAFLKDATELTPARGVFVAITIIEDAAFTGLVSADGAGKNFIGTGTASDAGDSTGSDILTSDYTFSAGTTIFGRRNSITLAACSLVAYIG